jgi:hypothetical protein
LVEKKDAKAPVYIPLCPRGPCVITICVVVVVVVVVVAAFYAI